MKSLRGRVLSFAAAACLAVACHAPPSHGGDTFDGRQFYSGEELYDWCRSPDPIDRRACEVYVCGVMDTWTSEYLESRATPYRICIGDRPDCRVLGDAVLKYLEEHPANRRVPATEVAGYALQQALVCR